MAKKKYPSELNTITIRVNIGIYARLREIASRNNLTMAEALERLVTVGAAKEAITVPPTQIPMTVFTARSIPAMSVNGNKRIAIAIKSKGGIING